MADFLDQPLAFLAHRGSGGEFPEHNRLGQEASIGVLSAAGYVPTIEVSVVSSADKVLFCQHDLTFDRTTTGTGSTTAMAWSQILNTVTTKESNFLGAGWQGQPLTLLQPQLDRMRGRAVVFLEPKDNPSVPLVKELIESDPVAADWIVWKHHYTNSSFAWAKAAGLTCWAYMDPTTTDAQLNAVDANIDIWGVPHNMSDARIAEVVARGKPVICWEVHRRSDVERLTGLGVWGMMCSRLLYVTRTATQFNDLRMRSSDSFATRIAGIGNIGRIGMDRTYQLAYTVGGEAYFPTVSGRSAVMGEMSMVPPPANYTIKFSQMWPVMPTAQLHSGIAFGKEKDDIYQFNTANPTGGYHIAFRANGDFQLYRHDPGATAGVKLAESLATQTPVAGTYATFEVRVTPTTVTAVRTDTSPNITLSANDTLYRGGYFHLSTGSVTVDAQTPHWKTVSMDTTV